MPELTPLLLTAVRLGSREVDAIEGIIPVTLDPLEAYKHAMVPGPWVGQFGLDKATQMAKDAYAKFINGKTAKAKEALDAALEYEQSPKFNVYI